MNFTNVENIVQVVALYNYMNMFFSLNDNYKSISKIEFCEISQLNIEKFTNNQYEQLVKSIRGNVKNVLDVFKKTFKDFEKVPIDKKHNIFNTLKLCYIENYYYIINSFRQKNSLVFSSIRNSVEHGNFGGDNKNINLFDLPNQNEPSFKVFECSSTPDNFFNLLDNLENVESFDLDFDNEKFMGELKQILDKVHYEQFVYVSSILQLYFVDLQKPSKIK